MKDKTKLRELVRNHIKERYQEMMLNAIQPSIRLKTFRKKDVSIGNSKFGGIPHLPKSITWPHNEDNKPYSFIAQINLEDISHYEVDALLPQKGMLYFFLDMDSWDDGVVFYFPQTESLYSPKIPKELEKEKKSFFQKLFRLKGKKYVLETCSIKTYLEYYLPAWDSLAAEKMRLISGEKKAPIFKASFSEEKNGIENETVSNHHLLGRYNGIQNEYHELAFIEGTTSNELNVMEIDQALQWKLLLQVDSDNQLGVSWGDWGKIYFFIHEKDLKEFNFDKVAISGECY